jgi:hypothetical protein
MRAATMGLIDIVSVLIAAPDIQINLTNPPGNTALMLAAFNGHLHVVNILLKVPGIDLNIKNTINETALMGAAMKGNTAIIDALLLIEGIQTDRTDQSGDTALLLASDWHHREATLRFLSAMTFNEVTSIQSSPRISYFANQCTNSVAEIQKTILCAFLLFRQKPALSDRNGPIRNVLSFIYDDWYRHRGTRDENLMLKRITQMKTAPEIPALSTPLDSASREKPVLATQGQSKNKKARHS